MALLPNRHPQRDFFVLDISDVVPKDDTTTMEHPVFSLATKPDMRHLIFEDAERGIYLKIIPSGVGLPTVFDKDILIFCISQLMHLKNQGKPIGKKVRFSARALMMATNRPTDDKAYKRLEGAFHRLIGTTFTTNIVQGDYEETRIFTLLESGSGFVVKRGTRRLDYCEVILSDWFMSAIEAASVLTISEKYFQLRRPLERRLYEIGKKQLGNAKKWHIGLEKLQAKTGSNAPLKKFRLNLRQIIEENHTPDICFELSPDDDLVTVRPRKVKHDLGGDIFLPLWAEEKAREIAHAKGWDYHGLLQEWQGFARSSGKPPENAGAAFIGFVKKKKSLR